MRGLAWLVSGLVLGAGVAAALVLLVADLVRGDAPMESAPPPGFIEEAGGAGLSHVYEGEFEFFVGGGVAVLDCNDDGMSDLYFAGGSVPASLYINESSVGEELRFAPKADGVTDMESVTGAYPIDIDSDGITDLAVLRLGENVVLRGLGQCRFERANETWGIEGGDEWTVGFSATWESEENLPTMLFGNYIDLDAPGRDRCADHELFRPERDRYVSPIELAPGWCTLSALFSDWGDTGRRDLRLTNDRHYYRDGEEQMWRVEPGVTPALYTREDGWRRMEIWGMGIASRDLTGDGLPEVYLTSQGDNKLQKLTGTGEGPEYEDIALTAGATAHRPFRGDTNRPSTAWHAEFGDVNNDGFVDLFVTKGNVDNMSEFAMEDPNNLLLGQPGGTFVEGAEDAGLLDFARSRGAAVTDLNLDGLLDVVVVERRERVKLWRNLGTVTGGAVSTGNWVQIRLRQTPPNVDSIGSWVELRLGSRVDRHEVTIGGGHAGGDLGWLHFGLGSAEDAEIRVIWPDGESGPWMRVGANRLWVIDRDSGPSEWAVPD